MKFFSVLLLCLFSSLVLADNGSIWISSGGESFYDAKNPWFLAQEKITFCLEADTTQLSLDERTIQKQAIEAFHYWQDEFKNNQGPILGHNRKSFQLGKNTLIPSPHFNCKGDEDLRVLIGSETLNKEEKDYLFKDNRNYIGVSVRTGYDPKTLRGKGFIYIASDKDINGQNQSPDFIKSPWKNEKLLKLALIHEFGHVFGVPHMGSSIMSEVFMDLLISKYYFKDFVGSEIESFRAAPKVVKRCKYLTPDMHNFYSADSRVSCLILKWKSDKAIDVYASYPSGKEEILANIVSLEIDFFGIESRPLSFLRLTKEQGVFSPGELGHRTLVAGPLVERYRLNGKIIVLKEFKSYPLQLSVSPESVTATSILNGKIVTVFAYDSVYSGILGQSLDLQL